MSNQALVNELVELTGVEAETASNRLAYTGKRVRELYLDKGMSIEAAMRQSHEELNALLSELANEFTPRAIVYREFISNLTYANLNGPDFAGRVDTSLDAKAWAIAATLWSTRVEELDLPEHHVEAFIEALT